MSMLNGTFIDPSTSLLCPLGYNSEQNTSAETQNTKHSLFILKKKKTLRPLRLCGEKKEVDIKQEGEIKAGFSLR